MKPIRSIEEAIRSKFHVTAGSALHDRVLAQVRQAKEQSETTPALRGPVMGRTIMRSPVIRFAAAAAIVAAVVLGWFEFLGTGAKSGVVWAEVAQRVDASRGTIYRMREIIPDEPKGADYATVYSALTRERADYYKGDQVIRSIYADYKTKTVVYLVHEGKRYIRDTHSLHQFGVQQRQNWVDPKGLVQKLLSCEHRKLEPQMVEGTLCEGLETTDPTFFGSDFPVAISRLDVQLWVSVQTGYPVLLKCDAICGKDGKRRIEATADQFQWDVELDPSELEPEMPTGYTLEEWPS